jgi:flagellar hook-length control protein FliK
MLATLDAMNQNGEHSNDPAFNQLQEALEQIEAGGEVTDVATLLEALPEVSEALPEERAPVLQRLMGWVSAAIDKHKEAPASAMPDGTVQSLQASLFPASDDAAVAAAQASAQALAESKKNRVAESPALVAVIVPTAQSLVMPEWVRKLGEGEETIAAVAINEAIPPLTLEQGEEGLPVVDLPGSEDFTPAIKGGEKVAKDVDALLSAAPAPANIPAEQVAAPIVQVEANTVTALSNAPSVQNTSTLNPITISAYTHLAPHTAAAEQVHVAITTMKDEKLSSITLQLEPADMGRVEIRMDTVEGKTNISFLVDKPETLDSLARDARSLERMLQEAGVRADAGSMEFNLRQQANEQADADDADGNAATGSTDEISALPGAVTQHYTLNVKDGVDIHA